MFAERNADVVTIRDIAAAAGVSPALVLRHYASKDGLRASVDEHVLWILEAMLSEIAALDAGHGLDGQGIPTLADQVAQYLPANSPIPAYLTRMLITDSPQGTALFGRLHQLAQNALTTLVRAGMAADGGDLPARAAFLLANDLAVLMLRERLGEVLGLDPLSPAGLHRWGQQVLAVYTGGLAGVQPRQR